MSAIGKAALILAAMSSGLAMAQAPQASPAQKPSPATSASPVPNVQPRVSPYAQRLANSQSQLRANQPVNPAQPVVRPVTPQPVIPRAMPVVQPRPVAPQPVQPATPAPVAVQPPVQPAVAQPAIAAPSISNGPVAVDYSHGQLTVVSERATLGQVLKLVAAKTGGVVDVAPELQNEPVMARLGPGPAREVLTDLLDSPKIDYIVMGAGDKGLERIVVRTRQSFGRTAMAAIHPTQPQPEEAVNANQAAQQSNAPIPNGAAPAEAKLTQEQLMENWKKTREQMRMAEIQQQAEEREKEQNHVQAESQPEQPTEPPPPGDNPPQR